MPVSVSRRCQARQRTMSANWLTSGVRAASAAAADAAKEAAKEAAAEEK